LGIIGKRGEIRPSKKPIKQRLNFLKKKELNINPGKGWRLVSYKNYPLGWINVLSNRINNYYPKELRILKDI